jgi:hypothetical protein
MNSKFQPALVSYAAGTFVFILGILMLCYCPWMFAISAVAFGVAAATATQPLLRWTAVLAIGMSVSMAIHDAAKKEQTRNQALELQRYNDDLQKSRANHVDRSEQN